MDQLKVDVKRTARINQTLYPSEILEDSKVVLTAEDDGKNSSANILDLFRPSKMLFRTICMFYNWMVNMAFLCNFVYEA